MNDQDLRYLFQLKSCPESTPVVIEAFIYEFQRRQRARLLQSSFWELWKERLHLFIAEFQVPKMAYVSATALALIVSAFLFFYDPSSRSNVTPQSYPVAEKGFLNYNSSSLLLPQNTIIPASFQKDGVNSDAINPDDALIQKQQRLKNFLGF